MWIQDLNIKRRIQAFEITAYWRLLRLSWIARHTNEIVLQRYNLLEHLLTTQAAIRQSCYLHKELVHGNTRTKNWWEEETARKSKEVDRWSHGRVKETSGRMYTTSKSQAAMKNVGTGNNLRLKKITKVNSRADSNDLHFSSLQSSIKLSYWTIFRLSRCTVMV